MSNMQSLQNRLRRLKAAMPTGDIDIKFSYAPNYSLFTPQEQIQLHTLIDSLPHEYTLAELSREQFRQLHWWVGLSVALQTNDTVKADINRIKLDPSNPALQTIIDRFLSLDVSSLLPGINDPGPSIVIGHVQYFFPLKGYQSYESLCAMIDKGHAVEIVEDLYRWVECLPKLTH
jgi:hypothetical protein